MKQDPRGAHALAWLLVIFCAAGRVHAETLLIDNFQGSEDVNRLGNRVNVFLQDPSESLASRWHDVIESTQKRVLVLKYKKNNKGGPFDSGGWCGYYTLLKSGKDKFFNASRYQAITFWVRGKSGYENFVIGVADRRWDKLGDSVKSQEIGVYLPSGKLTTEWQKATIPLSEFFVDMEQLAAISIVFDGDLYPTGGQLGTIYLADIVLE